MRAVFMMMLGSCLSCGTLKSTWVKNLLDLDGHLIDLQLAQAQINELLLALHLLLWHPPGHVPDQVHYAARVVPLVVIPAHSLHEGGVQLDAGFGIKVKEMGSVSKLVETNASSA